MIIVAVVLRWIAKPRSFIFTPNFDGLSQSNHLKAILVHYRLIVVAIIVAAIVVLVP
jgi:hypothetical protein